MDLINPMEAHDLEFYETRIRDWIPDHIIDAHNHAHLKKFYMGDHLWKQNRGALWPLLAAEENSVENIEESYRNLFPDKKVTPLMVGKVSRAFESGKHRGDSLVPRPLPDSIQMSIAN